MEVYRGGSARAFARRKTVFVSDFLRRQFLRAVPQAALGRTRVIHNFIDYPRVAAQAQAAGAPRAGEVVMVGRIDTGKGFAECLAALLPQLPPAARVTVVGDGPARAALAARHAGAPVQFPGWRDYDATLALAARAHVCVVPSLCEEACSTTVLEALALGRPCVALARGGTPELAAYQLYPGQLRLAPDMAALAAQVGALLAAPPAAMPLPAQFGADAGRILNQLLEFYAD